MVIIGQALYLMVREGKYEEATSLVEQLLRATNELEPRNAGVYASLYEPLIRTCGRNEKVLTICCIPSGDTLWMLTFTYFSDPTTTLEVLG